MRRVGETQGSFLNRIYYEDDNGDLVAEIQAQDVSDVVAMNQAMTDNFRAFNGDNVRVTANIPVSLYYQWIIESGLPGWATREQQEYITKKLQDPAYKYVCAVPENYQHMTR